SARRLVTSVTSTFTMTLAGFFRVIGDGTFGACVSTAVSTLATSGSTGFAPLNGAVAWLSAAGNFLADNAINTAAKAVTPVRIEVPINIFIATYSFRGWRLHLSRLCGSSAVVCRRHLWFRSCSFTFFHVLLFQPPRKASAIRLKRTKP